MLSSLLAMTPTKMVGVSDLSLTVDRTDDLVFVDKLSLIPASAYCYIFRVIEFC